MSFVVPAIGPQGPAGPTGSQGAVGPSGAVFEGFTRFFPMGDTNAIYNGVWPATPQLPTGIVQTALVHIGIGSIVMPKALSRDAHS